jgi:hypothetical protein
MKRIVAPLLAAGLLAAACGGHSPRLPQGHHPSDGGYSGVPPALAECPTTAPASSTPAEQYAYEQGCLSWVQGNIQPDWQQWCQSVATSGLAGPGSVSSLTAACLDGVKAGGGP